MDKNKKYRKYKEITCFVCGKKMNVRLDYFDKHSGICMSCQKIGNNYAKKHSDTGSRIYRIWSGLKHRRGYKHNPSVCEEWSSYENFRDWATSNGYEDHLTIDRIDNNGDYEPDNCRWISLEENSGKDKRLYTESEEVELWKTRARLGITQTEMAELVGVSRSTIQRSENNAKESMI